MSLSFNRHWESSNTSFHVNTKYFSKKLFRLVIEWVPAHPKDPQSLTLESAWRTKKKYDIDNLTQQHLLYKQFVDWNCNGSSIAPLTDYMNNPILQELPDEDTYFSAKNDERIYLDLRTNSGYVKEAGKLERNDSKIILEITLKATARYKLRVSIWTYSLSEYLYVQSKSGLTLKHRTYSINQSDEAFLEWVEENSQ